MFPAPVSSAEVRGSHGAADHGLALTIRKQPWQHPGQRPRPSSPLPAPEAHWSPWPDPPRVSPCFSLLTEWASGREGLSSRRSARSTSSLRPAACGPQRWPRSVRSGVRKVTGSHWCCEVESGVLGILRVALWGLRHPSSAGLGGCSYSPGPSHVCISGDTTQGAAAGPAEHSLLEPRVGRWPSAECSLCFRFGLLPTPC